MASLMNRFLQRLWGVPAAKEPVIAAAIDCADCLDARTVGRDACEQHHSHRGQGHPLGSMPSELGG